MKRDIECIPALAAIAVIRWNPAPVPTPRSPNIRNGSPVRYWIDLIFTKYPGLWGIEVPRVDYDKLSSDRLGETSEVIRSRVEAVRQIQRERFSLLDTPNPIACNADMRVVDVRRFCKLDEAGESLVRAAISCCA